MKRSTLIGTGATGVLVATAVVLAIVASATTSSHGAAKPTPVSSQISHSISSSPAPSSSGAASSNSPTSTSPSSTASSTPVDTSTPGQAGTPCADGTILTTAQLATSALHEGQAVHAIVSPFGCVTAYKVAVGDTLFDIAHSFSVSGAYLTLYQWNASVVGKDPALIHPGQVIIVDPTGKVTAPQ